MGSPIILPRWLKLLVPSRVIDETKRIHQSSPAMTLIRIFLFLVAASGAALAQTNAPEIRKLSLEDCLQIAIEHNLDVQIKRYNPEISRFNLGVLYGAYDQIGRASW